MAQTGVQYQGMPSAGDSPAISEATVQPQTQQPVQGQQPMQRPEGERRRKYKQILFGLGVTEVILGSICILFGLVAVIIAAEDDKKSYQTSRYRGYHGFTYVSQGIWCGIFIVATGVLGIKAKGNPSVAMYNANMALSIITANLMVPLMTLSTIAAILESSNYWYGSHLTSLIVLPSIIVVAGFIAGIVCIVHSAYCCAGVCCQNRSYGHTVAFTAPAYCQQQMVMLPNGQYVSVQMQPHSAQGYPIANAPMTGTQVVYHPPQGQTVVPPVVTQPQGQTAAPVVWPQGQSAPPPYSGQPAMYPQPTQATAPQPMAYPQHQQALVGVGPMAPSPDTSFTAPPTQLGAGNAEGNAPYPKC